MNVHEVPHATQWEIWQET